MPTTDQRQDATAAENVRRPIWELTADEFAAFQVTERSIAGDPLWKFVSTTPGAKPSSCQINWAMTLYDQSVLDEPRHFRRVSWAKKLLALMLHAPAERKPPAAGTILRIQLAFKWLLSWMASRGMHTPDQIDVEYYIENLPRFIAECNDEDEITVTQVTLALQPLSWLWSERRLLERWGIGSLSQNPFRDRSINQIAKSVATKAQGWIPPLPDEVAIPLFNEVDRWLGQRADDVIALLDYVNDLSSGGEVLIEARRSANGLRRIKAGSGRSARVGRSRRFLSDFRFAVLPGESEPWHPSLGLPGATGDSRNAHARVRVLFDAVRDACVLCLQGQSGMRISEVLGVTAGFDNATGLPKGVRIEDSATGLYEVFVLRTVMSKTEEGLPREMDWVLGMRPKGSTHEPLPVRSLRILNRIYAPWRERAKTDRLILAGIVGPSLPTKAMSLGPMTATKLLSSLKRFISRWIDLTKLPDESRQKVREKDLVPWRESKGSVFKSHMLRKSWAQFVFAVDPRLMPAIQLQFHHLSMAMTDTGYIGSNPLLLTDMESVGTQARNQMILSMVLGVNPLAGKMGERLEHVTKELADEVKGLPISEAYDAVVDFCEHAQLQIFFSPHGACMPVQTHEMRCQKEAQMPLLMRRFPNPQTRQPSLCTGCACFLLDARHADFWVTRYLNNWLAFRRAEARGDTAGFKVIKERGSQAGKFLKKIGYDVGQIDIQIESILDSDTAA